MIVVEHDPDHAQASFRCSNGHHDILAVGGDFAALIKSVPDKQFSATGEVFKGFDPGYQSVFNVPHIRPDQGDRRTRQDHEGAVTDAIAVRRKVRGQRKSAFDVGSKRQLNLVVAAIAIHRRLLRIDLKQQRLGALGTRSPLPTGFESRPWRKRRHIEGRRNSVQPALVDLEQMRTQRL
ncbi:MAG: hypothetical protein ABS96_28855 [Lysobacteraceae bacterium SCN 69-123]|nr:MAG: hypothetical protein ABS96_28855 [Xanthomonadaceae bacterium SCN 69-123]